MDTQTWIVLAIVGVAILYVGTRALKQVRSLRAKKSGTDCGCDGCGH